MMNKTLIELLSVMFKKHYIGAKHIPESVIFKSKIKHLNKHLQKEFYDDYEKLLRQNYFIRLKKRTGKSSDYHISLNPEMIEEINELLEENYENS